MKKEKINGFTLIELLTVIAIIGILASIVMPNLSDSRKKARDSERVTEISQIALALESYYNACRQYPSSLAITANNGCPSGVTLGTFLTEIPQDPLGSTQPYMYAVNGTYDTFVIRAKLELNNSALNNDLDVSSVPGIDCSDNPTFYYCKG